MMTYLKKKRDWPINVVNESVWQIQVHLRVVYCANFLNIGQQNGVIWKDMIDILTLLLWDPVRCTCFNLTVLNKVLIDSWRTISKSVYYILWFELSFGVRDVDWQVRMHCAVQLRLCVYYKQHFFKFLPSLRIAQDASQLFHRFSKNFEV